MYVAGLFFLWVRGGGSGEDQWVNVFFGGVSVVSVFVLYRVFVRVVK